MRTKRILQAGSLWALLVLAACASQAEGERCDRTNGDGDCESGLRCTPYQGSAICCPEDRAANVDACRAADIGTGGSTGTGGSRATGGSGAGGASSGGSDSGASTGGTSTDASPGLPPDAGIDGAAQ